jgi:uncharacterized ferritin-like protein (DUF455 family)
MRLNKWALLAEICSAVAVLVTLVLLIMEVNKNTKATQIATYTAISSEFNAADLALAADPELASLVWDEGRDRSASEEHRRFGVLRAGLRTFESAYFAYEGGNLSDGQWQRFERNVCGLWINLSANQREALSFNLTEEFVRHLDSHCDGYAGE